MGNKGGGGGGKQGHDMELLQKDGDRYSSGSCILPADIQRGHL